MMITENAFLCLLRNLEGGLGWGRRKRRDNLKFAMGEGNSLYP